MKPNSQISSQLERSQDGKFPAGRRPHHPRIDWSFHAPASEVRSAGSSQKLSRPVFAPGFRDLSNKFLATEAKRNYVAEVLFFVVIVVVSTWPIVSMVHALGQLPR
jgi:hypothetical protein